MTPSSCGTANWPCNASKVCRADRGTGGRCRCLRCSPAGVGSTPGRRAPVASTAAASIAAAAVAAATVDVQYTPASIAAAAAAATVANVRDARASIATMDVLEDDSAGIATTADVLPDAPASTAAANE